MEKRAWYQSPEMIIGLSALVVSLVAVFVGIYSAYIDREYARASVWPRLEIYRSFSSQAEKFEYGVSNSGTGPAIINFVKVAEQGNAIKYWRELTIFQQENVFFTQSQIGNRIIPTQQTVKPLQISGKSKIEKLADFIALETKNISIQICYCSIYDECWLTDRTNNPAPVNECKLGEQARFLQ